MARAFAASLAFGLFAVSLAFFALDMIVTQSLYAG